MNQTTKRILIAASTVMLVLSFCAMLLFMRGKSRELIDSDMSSELVLSSVLADEHAVLSEKWFYSTELRVLNTQLVFASLFHIFTGYTQVRVAGTAVLWIVMLTCLFLLCRSLRLQAFFPLLGTLLLVPFSRDYLTYVLLGSYYIPHICITMATLTLLIHTLQKRHVIASVAVNCALAVLAGMGGIRMIVLLYVPLLPCVFLLSKGSGRKERWDLMYRYAPVFLCSVLGLAVNMFLLSRQFSFRQLDTYRFRLFDVNALGEQINALLSALGYVPYRIRLTSMLKNGCCMALLASLFVLLPKGLKEENRPIRFLILYACTAFTVNALASGFTNVEIASRFMYPYLVILLIPAVYLLSRSSKQAGTVSVILLVVVPLLCSGALTYRETLSEDRTWELRQITNVLEDHGCSNGYATFWNGNVLTELSDGRIEVYTWEDMCDGALPVQHLNDLNDWLQKKEHFYRKPSGEVFLLLSRSEYDWCEWTELLAGSGPIYSGETYLLYLFEDYDTLSSLLGKYVGAVLYH